MTQISKWESDTLCQLNLNPDYQRAHVWTLEQQIAYVEYALQGGEVGKNIIFNCPDDEYMARPFELIDGKQRLEAARSYANEIPIFDGHYSTISKAASRGQT